jgi:hypothetical protein
VELQCFVYFKALNAGLHSTKLLLRGTKVQFKFEIYSSKNLHLECERFKIYLHPYVLYRPAHVQGIPLASSRK